MENNSYKMFGCFTRKFKHEEARPPEDVIETFATYAGGDITACMSIDRFQRFLVEVQGVEAADAVPESERIYRDVDEKRNQSVFSKQQGLSLDEFFAFLFDCDLNCVIGNEVHNDMTAPLQHYFIYTGHNSYLTGNQLSSDCSDVPIIKALQRGVRVIELDLWPISTKDDVVVLHGRTLTAPVPLSRCLNSIKEHAFDVSPYPVIITLEDHLTTDLQAKVAKMVTDTFGNMLFYPQSESLLQQIPSPEELKYKIILSTKPPKEYLETKKRKEKQESSSAMDSSGGEPASQEALEDETSGNSDSDPEEDDAEATNMKSTTAPEYVHLIAIHAGKPKNGLQEELTADTENVRRLSLSEVALEKAASCFGMDIVRFTQKNFLRIYPKGTRISSSNYQPMVAWSHGAQMVAFNMQGYGSSLWLMHGMFRSNGGCGYLKKPEILMKKNPNAKNTVFDPKASLPVKKALQVTVYMGNGWSMDYEKTYFDTYSPPDFYAKLKVVGVSTDSMKQRTKVVEDNWIPVWDEEIIFTLTVPELALLQIKVKERDMSEKDDFGGQSCLPISEIKQGFRAVPLFDKKGDKLPNTKLLMRFVFV